MSAPSRDDVIIEKEKCPRFVKDQIPKEIYVDRSLEIENYYERLADIRAMQNPDED